MIPSVTSLILDLPILKTLNQFVLLVTALDWHSVFSNVENLSATPPLLFIYALFAISADSGNSFVFSSKCRWLSALLRLLLVQVQISLTDETDFLKFNTLFTAAGGAQNKLRKCLYSGLSAHKEWTELIENTILPGNDTTPAAPWPGWIRPCDIFTCAFWSSSSDVLISWSL